MKKTSVRTAIVTLKPKVKVPENVYSLLWSLDQEIPDSEFILLTKGHWNDDGEFEITEDYYLPEQEVSQASAMITEAINKYNVILHKHPGGVTRFSSTDFKFLTPNYDCSLLYCDGEITDSTIRFIVDINGKKKIVYIRDPEILVMMDTSKWKHITSQVKKKVKQFKPTPTTIPTSRHIPLVGFNPYGNYYRDLSLDEEDFE